jgi:hypothetical protein
MILQGLKPRIFDRPNKFGRKWLQELPAVVWSLRTTPSRATGFTPFFLVYGAEAILPTDLEYGSPRVQGYDEGANQQTREDSLDQLDEARVVALMHSARYQQALRRYQARKVRCRDFSEGDLVMRLPGQSRPPQAVTPMGGTLHRGEGAQAWHIQDGQRRWRRAHQRLEHTTATSLLPLARISKFFVVNYMPNTPIGSLDVNISKLIKLKGNLAFPRKPSHPRGLLRGAFPPKNGPIFRKKFASSPTAPQPKSRASLDRARVAKRERRVSWR